MKTNQTPLAEYVSRQNSGTKYALAIQAEYAALLAVAEAAKEAQEDGERMLAILEVYANKAVKQNRFVEKLAARNQALSALAAVREGKAVPS